MAVLCQLSVEGFWVSKFYLTYSLGRQVVSGFVNVFFQFPLNAISCLGSMAASYQPLTSCGTFMKHSTKPFWQSDAQDCTEVPQKKRRARVRCVVVLTRGAPLPNWTDSPDRHGRKVETKESARRSADMMAGRRLALGMIKEDKWWFGDKV